MRTVSLALLLALGCSPPSDPPPPPVESPAVQALRAAITAELRQTSCLVFISRTPIPDGGSVDYLLKTDTGADFIVEAAYLDPRLVGPLREQEFRIERGREGFWLGRRSALEARLIELLDRAQLVDSPDPTRDARDLKGLRDRLRSRSLK